VAFGGGLPLSEMITEVKDVKGGMATERPEGHCEGPLYSW